MPQWGYCHLWYHGSTRRLTRLAEGSTITQHRNLARALAHRPSLVSLDGNGTVRHNGTEPGYIYCVSEEVRPRDVKGHTVLGSGEPGAWVTERPLRIKLIGRIEPDPDERLTDQEALRLRKDTSRPDRFQDLSN